MARSMHDVAPLEPTRFTGGDLPVAVLKKLSGGPPRDVASLLLNRRRELDVVARCLVDERLGVYAYAATTSLSLAALWPASAWARLRDQWTRQQRRNADLLHALAAIDSAFAGADVEYLLLKGLPLADRFYGGLTRRFTWDLDLLVRESDVARGLGILARIGVRSPSLTRGLHRLARRVAHALECRRQDGLSVDLHWAFRRLPGLRFPAHEIFLHQRSHELAGRLFRVPSDEDTLVQVLLGIAADVDRSLCRMRSLWDAYLLLRSLSPCDWTAFFGRREAEGCLGLTINSIALVIHRMNAADEFPELLRAIETSRCGDSVLDAERAAAILARPPHSFRNHLEFSSWQSRPQWRYWSWWAASLPARAFLARRM